jgi:energy-coupling factor transporter ATP-binding protein EcfA2
VDTVTHDPRWWGTDPPPPPRSIVDLLVRGTLDAELAALVWLLLEHRVPLVVAGRPGSGRTTLLTALLGLVPALPLRLATGLARRSPDGTTAIPELAPGRIEPLVLHTLLRDASRGAGLVTTVPGDSLEDVLQLLAGERLGLSEDEVRALGVVLVLGAARRVVAAHYLRPVERDAGGHLRRRPPAVLATHDPDTDAFEHFAWGVTPELADRIGLSQARFEQEQDDRAAFLQALVAHRVTGVDAVTRAIAGRTAAVATPAQA